MKDEHKEEITRHMYKNSLQHPVWSESATCKLFF